MIYTVKSLYQITKNYSNMPFWLKDLDTTLVVSLLYLRSKYV